MPLFDLLNQTRDLLAGFDPLQGPVAPVARESGWQGDDGRETVNEDWASLGHQPDDQGLQDTLFAGDGIGGDVAPVAASGSPAASVLASLQAWMDGQAEFGMAPSVWEFSPGPDDVVAPGGNMSGNAAPGGPEVMTVDFVDFAKGGNGGGGGGGGKPGGGSDGGGDPNVRDSYTSGGEYNIAIKFKGGDWTSDLQQAFIDSADLLSNIITADIADVFYRGKILDDIQIDAELTAIDGEGGILGQAGPTAIRTSGYLPATAIMQFDTADATAMNTTDPATDVWDEVVLHEMLHSIGFGSIWSYLGLVDDTGADPVFTGQHAQAAASGTVMVEGDGGAGTALSHWDDVTYGSEIMTGYLYGIVGSDGNGDPIYGDPSNVDADLSAGTPSLTDDASVSDLSNMTIASLEDLGYQTIWPDGDNLFA